MLFAQPKEIGVEKVRERCNFHLKITCNERKTWRFTMFNLF